MTVNVVVFPPYATVIVCVPSLSNLVGVHVKPSVISFVVPLLYVAVKTKPVVFNVSPAVYVTLLGFVFIAILFSVGAFTVTVNVVVFPSYVTVIVCVPSLSSFVGVHVKPSVISFVNPVS